MRTAVLAALLAACALHGQGDTETPPLRRVAVPAEKVPEILKKAGGALVRMPLAEFERLYREAETAEASRRTPPRLIEARYRAALIDGALQGTLEWKIRHDGAAAALLRLGDDAAGLGLAVKSPRFENREALLAEFPTPGGVATPAVLIDGPGEHTVTAEWSARVDVWPDGLHAELRLPPCPASSVEIDLPDDASLALLEWPARADKRPDAIVSGPHPSEKAGRRSWRVAAGGRTALPLLIRRAGSGGAVFARQEVTQRLTADGVVASYVFAVEALHQDVRELLLEHDPALRPLNVVGWEHDPALRPLKAVGSEVERWEARPGPAPLVAVRLRRPLRKVWVELKALAPLCPDSARGTPWPWISPWVRLRGAVPRGEQLDLHVSGGLETTAWDAGDFQLTKSAADAGGRRLELLGGAIASGGKTRRPGLTVRAGAVSFHVRQLGDWRIGLDGAELTARLAYRVRHGRMFEMSVALPAGWEAAAADLKPAGLLRGWGVRAGNVLIADLARPLEGEATLTLRLHPAKGGAMTGRELAFPDVVPVGARHREGGLGIDYDEQAFLASVKTDAGAGDAPADGAWGGRGPDLYYPFVGQAPAGTLRLAALPPRLRARAEVNVHVTGGRAIQETRLVLDAEGGRPSGADVFLSGPAGEWVWQGEPRLRVERDAGREAAAALAGLAARSPLEAVMLAGARPAGSFWSLSFGRAVSAGKPVVLRATRALPASGLAARPTWEAALPTVIGAARMEGDVSVHLAGGEQVAAEPAGLTDAPAGRGRPAWRAFRYTGEAARLVLRSRGSSGAAGVSADEARLVSVLSEGGALRHRFSFRLSGWTGSRLPVQLPAGARLTAASADGMWLDGVTVSEGEARIPVPARAGPVRLEIRYEADAPGGPWPRLEAPAPVLPARPLALTRLWLLPPGVRPVSDSAAVALPGTAAAGPRLRYPADVLRVGPMLPLPGRPEGVDAERARAVAEAATGIRNGRGGQMSREALVEQLAFVYLRQAHPLVVDAAALDGPLAPAAGPEPWRELGLAALPGRAGVVLTSAAQADAWGGAVPEDVEEALARAVAGGREPAGRFATALEWLLAPGGPEDARDAAAHIAEGWTAWRPPAGQGPTLAVVHTRAVTGIGAGLAAVLLAGVVATWGASAGVRLRWLIGVLALGGLGLAWLPGGLLGLARPPLLAGLVLAVPVLLTLRRGEKRAAPSTAGPRAAAAAALVLACAWLGGVSAQPGVPEAVYIVEGEGALLSPALHKRLQVSARPEPTAGAVLLAARYEGRMSGGTAEVEATFTLHSFREGRVNVEVPLDGVQLVGDVMLDGARVLARALPGPKGGYTVPVTGKGGHRVQMKFRVTVSGLGDEAGMRQMRFTAPRLWQAHLSFQAPAGATHLHAPGRGGAQAVKGSRIDAELGALAGPLTLQWHQEGKAAVPRRQAFRESYLWELRPDTSRLTMSLRYTLTGGTQALEVDVPAGLEVVSASAWRPRGVSAEVPVRLARWALAAGRLRLEFPGPVSGDVEAEVDLVPHGPVSGEALPLPRPHGEPVEPGRLAYFAPGLEVGRAGVVGLTGVKPAEKQDYAATFRRATAPRLRIEARPKSAPFDVEQRVRYTAGPRRAEFTASVRVVGAEGPAALAYDLGDAKGLVVTGVEGAGVGTWAQSGRSLLVWLDRRAGAALEVSGWLPLSGKPARLDLPCLRPAGAARVRTEVALAPEAGWQVVPQTLTQLVPSPRGPLEYDARGRQHGGAFQVRAAAPVTARVRTTAAARGEELVFESSVECLVPAGARAVTVRLRGWPGSAELEVPAGAVVRRREQSRRGPDRNERVWHLEPRAGVGRLTLVARGRMPLEEAAGGVSMPDVQAGPGERTLSVGEGLAADAGAGLEPAGAGAWHAKGPAWSLRLVPRRAARAARAEVLLQEVRATVPDGQAWLHEVVWRLKAGGAADLRVVLPRAAEMAGLEVDGAAVPARAEQGAVWLSLPASSGPRVVRLLYRLDPGLEALWRPELAAPDLEGARAGPVVWCVEAPAGWALAGVEALPAGVGRAALELYRARAGGGAVRLAGRALEGEGVWPLGPAGEDLAAWQATLRGREKASAGGGGARWVTAEGGRAPAVRLASLAGARPEEAVRATVHWGLVWGLVWAASVSVWLRAAGRWLWPEMVLAAGLGAWWAFGPTPVPVVMAAFGAVARLVLLAAWLRAAGGRRAEAG